MSEENERRELDYTRFTRRFALGVPRYEREEALRLADHVESKIRRSPKTGHTQSGSSEKGALHHEQDAYAPGDWVAFRFTGPLIRLLNQVHKNWRGHWGLSLVVIAGGFATSGIAAAAGHGTQGSLGSWIVFAIGLAVALAGGASQVIRPGVKAAGRLALVVELREEGWAFVNQSGRYSETANDSEEMFRLFDERLSAIHRRAAVVFALEPLRFGADEEGDIG